MAKATYNVRKLETAPYDKRVVARQISGGSVSYKDLSKHLSDLADSADNAEEITVTLEEEEEEVVEEEATEEPAAEA